MNLLVSFPKTTNFGFNYAYENILLALREKYPDYNITHYDCDEITRQVQQASYCGGSNMSILNTDTKKCVIVSFTDIARIHAMGGHGYDDFKIIEVYGGLAWGTRSEVTPQQISDRHQIRYVPFQYPLPYDDFEEYVQLNRKPYNPKEKIRKAIFLGMHHGERGHLFEYLKDHPLFEISTDYHPRHQYWEEMTKYAMIFSPNGNGEFCVRDVEGYGLGIPTLRSELLSETRYHPLIPNVHYIRGSEPTSDCRMGYGDGSFESYKRTAEQFIEAAEKYMYDDEFLINISNNGIEYYEKYSKFEYLPKLFMQLFDPEVLT